MAREEAAASAAGLEAARVAQRQLSEEMEEMVGKLCAGEDKVRRTYQHSGGVCGMDAGYMGFRFKLLVLVQTQRTPYSFRPFSSPQLGALIEELMAPMASVSGVADMPPSYEAAVARATALKNR
mgnify:FL=1